MSAALVSTGICLPPNEIPNAALEARLGEAVPKLAARTGILTRWYANEEDATSDLASRAGRMALERAGLDPRELDLVIVGTDTPDHITPSTSVIVQHQLGAKRAGTFDVGCACASFPTAAATAAGLMATNPAIRNVLVIGAYLMHRLADPADPMIFFYGDGAGAALFRASDGPGLCGSAFRADGAYAPYWRIDAGGTREPASVEAVEAGRCVVRMHEKYPSEINDEGWPLLFRTAADRAGWRVDEVDVALFTQVRRNQIERAMDALDLPLERAPMVMDRFGYTGSACIPMALHDAVDAGAIRPGHKVVMVGSGVGFNQAAVALEVGDEFISGAA